MYPWASNCFWSSFCRMLLNLWMWFFEMVRVSLSSFISESLLGSWDSGGLRRISLCWFWGGRAVMCLLILTENWPLLKMNFWGAGCGVRFSCDYTISLLFSNVRSWFECVIVGGWEDFSAYLERPVGSWSSIHPSLISFNFAGELCWVEFWTVSVSWLF